MRGPRTAAVAAGVSLVLLAAAPSPAGAVRTLAANADSTDPMAPLLGLVSLAAWGLVAWLLLVVVAAHATRLPGTAGRVATTALPRIAPLAVRRLLAPLLGLTVGLGLCGAAPAAASPRPPVPAAAVSLDWPAPAAAVLDWPMSTPAPAALRPASPEVVVVEPGDSLWGVAADHLPAAATNAQIAQAWPQWWSANRAAIGADPDLIHPGLLLTPPASR